MTSGGPGSGTAGGPCGGGGTLGTSLGKGGEGGMLWARSGCAPEVRAAMKRFLDVV